MKEELPRVVDELLEDYKSAIKIHVPNWNGGMRRTVAEELIRMGWRKQLPSN